MLVFIQQKGPDGKAITRLLAESGPLQGKIFRLKELRVSVGSASDNQIILPIGEIEPRHFEINLLGEVPCLRLLSPTAGCWVNDQKVQGAIALKHGSRITFGEVFAAKTQLMSGFSSEGFGDLLSRSSLSSSANSLPAEKPQVILSSRDVVPLTDDVRTMIGSPAARFFGRAKRPPRLAPPPGVPLISPTQAQDQKKLDILLAVGKALSRPEEIEVKVDKVLELLFDLMDIDRAAILVLNEDKKKKASERFTWSAYRDRHGPTDSMELSSTVINRVLEEGVAVLTQDAQNEDWLDGAKSVLGQAIRTCVCTPLKTSSGVLGVIYADSTRTSHSFSQDDMDFFTAFSNQAAVAIENTRLLGVALEKERIEQDLRVARRIQRWLFPKKIPSLPGYELAGDSQSMDQVGGDYFDYILLDQNRLALIVADVSGHGISSALIMTMTRSILRGTLNARQTPAEILTRVNELVSEDMLKRMFVTMALVILDVETGSFSYASAGHPPIMQYSHAQSEVVSLITKKTGPLGMSRWARLRPKYENHEGHLYAGDGIFIFSDGLLEAANPAGVQFGEERLQEAIFQHAGLVAEKQQKEIVNTVRQFCEGTEIGDDVTSILLKRSLEENENNDDVLTFIQRSLA